MRPHIAAFFVASAIAAIATGAGQSAVAQTPAPAASPSASPAPAPKPSKKPSRLSYKLDSYTSAINQQFVGPGTQPVEGATFAAGGAVAPGTPYDYFSKSPLTTGEGIHFSLTIEPTYALSKSVDLIAQAAYGSVGGSGNVAAYWGESILPTVNPHLGSRAISDPPAFTTHNAKDPVSAARGSILRGTIALHDGTGALNVGWFDLHQTAPFVFAQAPWTNTPAALVPQSPFTLGNGSPANDTFKERAQILPLHGADIWYKKNDVTLELASADLPSSATSPARVTTGSIMINRSATLGFSAQFATMHSAGPDTARLLFGNAPTLTPSAYGVVPQSTVFGQRMVVAGLGAIFPVGTIDAEARAGFSCYSANGVAVASPNCSAGSYYYGKIHHGFPKFDVALEATRFEARYAPAILPYGTLENVWSIGYAYPANWLQGAYQLVNNPDVGANRQGVRLSSTFIVNGIEARLAYGAYKQIETVNPTTAFSSGFVEPYFSPQLTAAGATLGTERRASATFMWHPKFADVTLDLADATIGRPAPAGRPQEAVSMNYPSGVLSLARSLSPNMQAAVGVARFAVDGSFNNSGPKNADLAESIVFAGFELKQNATSSYHFQYRLYSVHGVPTASGGPSPAFHGPQILFEQRFKS